MAHPKNKAWMSVPQFGAWDQKASSTDYSVAFSRARADRRTRKIIGRPSSLGNHEEFLSCNNPNSAMHRGDNYMKKGRSKSLRHLFCMAP